LAFSFRFCFWFLVFSFLFLAFCFRVLLAGKMEQSLYDRLGGVFAIALVVDRFSDSLLTNKIVGTGSLNPKLNQWHSDEYVTRLPGLKFMRTLWLCAISGGPFEYTGKSLRDAHFPFHIRPNEFDAVTMELINALDYYNIPEKERNEVVDAFVAQKNDVTAGSRVTMRDLNLALECPFANM
jgi:hemoglobin